MHNISQNQRCGFSSPTVAYVTDEVKYQQFRDVNQAFDLLDCVYSCSQSVTNHYSLYDTESHRCSCSNIVDMYNSYLTHQGTHEVMIVKLTGM